LLGTERAVQFSLMLQALQSRRVERLPDLVRLQGRILFLTEEPALVRTQLDGQDLDWTPASKLRDNISTDEITPAYICYYYDETLGDFPYLRSEEHTSELQSRFDLVCRLLLEKKNK